MTGRRYPVAALGVLAAVDGMHGYALLVLGPDIARTLGVGVATVATIGVLTMVAISLGALPLAALVRGGRFRAGLSAASGAAWAGLSALTAIVTGPWGLAALATADGATTASVRALHPSLIADHYEPSARVRALAAHRALDVFGLVAAPALVAALAAAGLTWRGIFLAVAAVSAAAALFAVRLRDPGIRFDRGSVATAPDAGGTDRVQPTTAEWVRALLAVPSIRRILCAQAAMGVFLAPLASFLFFYLEGRWGLDASGRGACFAAIGAIAILAVGSLAAEGDRRLAAGPDALVSVLWPLMPLTGIAFAAAVLAPSFGPMLGALALGFACVALVQTGTVALLVTLAPPSARSHATALGGIAAAGVGGIGGLLLMSGVQETLGLGGAIASLALPAAAAGAALRSAGPAAPRDLDRMDREASDEDRGAVATASEAGLDGAVATTPARQPALDARGIVFAYGHLRVLDGVDLCVAAGEGLAVLGANGSGKSTLLRVLSGFSLPAAGRVRLGGADVTFLDPERRAGLGMSHLLASGATFGSLSVRQSLELVAAGLDRSAGSSSGAAAAALERLPALAARADVLAVALSEGERRLLALAQVLLRRPRVLLADEPTRGLSEAAAADVVAMLSALKDAGAAIVVVEQSLGVAEALADRACFLERGRIRFEGGIADLRSRPDLLRPIFLPAAATEAAC